MPTKHSKKKEFRNGSPIFSMKIVDLKLFQPFILTMSLMTGEARKSVRAWKHQPRTQRVQCIGHRFAEVPRRKRSPPSGESTQARRETKHVSLCDHCRTCGTFFQFITSFLFLYSFIILNNNKKIYIISTNCI